MSHRVSGSVSIIENGRDGSVRFARGAQQISGYWTFGGGDVVAIVSMGSREDWQRDHAWALPERDAILQFVAAEVIRQRAPTCGAQIDAASGEILLRGADAAPASPRAAALPTPQARDAIFVRRYANIRAMSGVALLVIAVILAGVLWAGRQLLFVKPANGVPLGASVRTDRHIASLIQYTDPHLPEITGRGGNTTTSVSLLLLPLDGSAPHLVPVARKLDGNSHSLARILGSDGETVWFDLAGLYGVRLRDNALVSTEQLREANPGLDPRWWADSRGPDIVDGRLHLINDDRSAAIDVDPVSWKATPVAPKVRMAQFDTPEPADFLDAGSVPTREGEYLDAGLLRLAMDGPPLRLRDPDSVLMLFTSAPGLTGTAVIARVDLQGRVIWRTDTGLDRFLLKQILPGSKAFAFVGTRPAVAGKLSEPLVVIVDNLTGQLTAHSLWR